MSTQKKTDWIPNWQKVEKYPDPATTSARQWAWEFLRRSPLYQDDYADFEKKIIPEINKQVEKGIITPETAQVFISEIEEKGANCLMQSLGSPANMLEERCETESEHKLCLISWFVTPCSDHDLIENWDEPTPEIYNPRWHGELCDRYHLTSMHNPAESSAPLFSHTQVFSDVPLAHKYGFTQHLSPQEENEIAFMVDLDKPIKKQVKFIQKLCMQLRSEKKGRNPGAKQKEWQKQLRLLDAEMYGDTNSRSILAEEWGCTPSNLAKKSLNDNYHCHRTTKQQYKKKSIKLQGFHIVTVIIQGSL